MNEQNLRKLTTSEAREIGKKGGKASGRVRREKRTMKQLLEIALSMMVTNKKGETASRKEVIAIQLVNKAASGDLKAMDLLTKLIGEQVVRQETACVTATKVDVSALTDEQLKVLSEIKTK
ncbi:MAG: hypothetical protein IJP79_07380 [Paludibacteraceae bacterium]|nr:hypothetical protein [Paludibacteraceae bacterium]MBQ6963506.1 hypothetical protein [Paludibacteraceae bacterium]MBQ7662481.1 hypothetical protein [Prevotella sp.]MBQ7748296.1 hypothetical protein [Paludibacteraceae bacterium]